MLFFPQSISWPSFRYTFVSHISFTLIFNGLEHHILLLPVICYFSFFFFYCFTIYLYYLFIAATYCQLISIYYLINYCLLICSLITLKIYLVYSTVSTFYYCWPNYVPLFLAFTLSNTLLKPNISNRYHTLWYWVSIWLFCIFFFNGHTLRPL